MDIIEETIEIDDAPANEAEVPSRRRTLLEVWWELFKNIATQRNEKVSMVSATRVTETFPLVKLTELGRFFELFYDQLQEAADALEFEIQSDPDALEKGDDDAELNRHHYLNLLVAWQSLAKQREDAWDHQDPEAAVTMAAYIDAQRFLLGEQGVIRHLDEIGFTFSVEDAEELNALVNGTEGS